MLLHNFCYALRVLFRDRMLIFWTYAFPIILGTFFSLAFSNIENSERRAVIDIAVVENEEFAASTLWKEAMAGLSKEDTEEQLFSMRYTTEDEAKELLAAKEITGYFKLSDGEAQVVVASSGMEETVLRYAVTEIAQTEKMIGQVAEYQISQGVMPTEESLKKLSEEVLGQVQQEEGIRDASNGRLSYTMVEFYTLIAMTCLYGGMLGMTVVNQNLANMSHKGKRVAVGPTKKRLVILGSTLAGYVAQLLGIALLFAYTVFVLQVDYGNRLPLIVLITLVGCLAGLAMGIAAAVLIKASENTKIGVMLSVTMLGCFLSGMMGITMKYIIDKHLPLVNRLNPANMITDGLYALYYYDTLERYWFDVISLLVFAGLLLAAAMFGLRRQKYDSI